MKKSPIEKRISFIDQFDRSAVLRQIDKMIDDEGFEDVLGAEGVELLASRLMNARFFRHRLNLENRSLRSA